MAVSVLTDELRRALAATLTRERTRLQERLRSLQAAERALSESQGEESGPGGSLADVASDLAEQTLDVTLERAVRGQLAEVEAALDRIAEGRYGVCERCGQAIEVDRLLAVPWTRLCQRCATA